MNPANVQMHSILTYLQTNMLPRTEMKWPINRMSMPKENHSVTKHNV